MKKIGAYRCFVVMFIFLTADILNFNYFPASMYTAAVYPVAALLALPFYRLCAWLCAKEPGKAKKLVAPLYFLLASVMAGGILGRVYYFVNINNDFDMNLLLVSSGVAVTALWLCCLDGNGFLRYIDMAFFGMVACLAVFFLTAATIGDAGRLLPIFDGNIRPIAVGLWKQFIVPFSQGFIIIAWLSGKAEKKDVEKGAWLAAVAAALLLSAEQVKMIMSIGFEIGSRLIFPSYTVAGVKRLGSYGLHIEEVLVCGLLLGRIVKLGVLINFGGCCLNAMHEKIKIKPGACVTAAAAMLLGICFLGTAKGAALWAEIAYYPMGVMCILVPLAAAGFIAFKEKRKKSGGPCTDKDSVV